ncbi:response regulator transcription factor [Clostridium tarantellae]|uniref:Stage 0 sporulation protein A homolog n=1 Tax=Clostridium tarantellae TaxID=39493 RepID=A0A6I1MNQ7_9CLOT|nr:response regulator transcription factor [Clostridium tarantellae]MPQ45045.1 response regulator [Clostridium tarantellae]
MKNNVSILIVEDDKALSRGIVLALKSEKYTFYEANSLKNAKEYVNNYDFQLIILDVNLPDGNGLDFLNDIRKTSLIPVIILTANDMETDIVTGLEMGANDYVTKPFSLMVLRARVKAQLRQVTSKVNSFEINNFSFNFDTMEYKKGEILIELSKTEQKLLKVLVENRGNTLTREMLVDKIWTNGGEYVDENALSVTIKRLRNKLEDNPSKPTYIKTIYGTGYSWVVK